MYVAIVDVVDETRNNELIGVCFDLFTPAIIESEHFNRSSTAGGYVEKDSVKFRNRERSLDENHKRIAPYAFQIRFTLFEEDDKELDRFGRFCSVVGFRGPKLGETDSESREIFSGKNLHYLSRWFESLDWPVAFQLELLLHNGLVHALDMLNELRSQIIELNLNSNSHLTAQVLIRFGLNLRSRPLIAPETLTLRLQEAYTSISRNFSNADTYPSDVFRSYHITFTPTRSTLEGPYPIQSNRVIRLYPGYEDHFIRVDFREEDRMHFRWGREIDSAAFLSERVRTILIHGFPLGGRHFEFLGYSASALRNHSVWFLSPFDHPNRGRINARTIRKSLGSFEELWEYPSKYAARLALSFTATKPSVKITQEQWTDIPDRGNKPYEHTDGMLDIN